jgi:peptide/nickel transport system substrate-binding protein
MAATPAAAATSSLSIAPVAERVLSDNFNPFDTGSPLSQLGVPSYIYEPLVQYNELQVDQYYPWLAKSWSFSSSGQTITFQLRPMVRFDDGASLTASDVAYTFNLLKAYPGINDGIPIVSATAEGPTMFALTLSQPAYSYLFDIARIPIVKQGYAAGVNPATYVDRAPDGTGPYELARSGDASPSRVVLTGRHNYWQVAEPAIGQLVFRAYPDATALLSALAKGTLDWAGSYLPDIQAAYVQENRVDDHYWFPPVSCIALDLNLARSPTNQLALRQAISDAIDRDALSARVADGYYPPATSSSGLVLPTDEQFLVPEDTNDIDDSGNVAMAEELMDGSGYHLSATGHWLTETGHTIDLTIEDPAGAPLGTAAGEIATQLRAAGFVATAKIVTASRWSADLASGNFDASITLGSSGPEPYYMYENWLDPQLIVHGMAEGGDYERLTRATDLAAATDVTNALDAYSDGPSESAGANAAIEALANVGSEQALVLPLLYGVAWAEFSTRHASGWPSTGDPYEPAAPTAPFAEYTVLQLSPSAS